MSEVVSLRFSSKHLSLIVALVEVAAAHGTQSEFSRVYDMQVAQAALAPALQLRIPDNLKWSRHKLDVQATENGDKWLARISSSALQAAGAPTIQLEQARFLSIRLGEMLKCPSNAQCKQTLKTFFGPEREFELEPTVLSFAESAAVILHSDEFD